MKQFLTLCAMAILVGCGGSLPSSEADDLGTIEAAVCGKSSCGSGNHATSYYCDSSCPNATSCNSAFNAATCVALDLSGPISICSGNCPSGYYPTAIRETADCRPGATSGAGTPNRRDCAVKPAPGAVASYTTCGINSGCATGYHADSNVHLDSCYFAGLNATLCMAN
ncbi:MAG TPA: hypothetical protein VF815_11045 [Myxococcaceae bacterium]